VGSLLVRNATVLACFDDARREITGGGLYAEDGWIVQVGETNELPSSADEVVDADGHVVIPGLVNTHHHLYQTLTRAVPGAQDVGLFDWLRILYPIWARMTPDHVRLATTVGLAELALSGCTTAFDHHYLWPNGSSLSDQVEGADQIRIRFHASRGSMSLGESDGGLPPDSVVETEDAILEDSAGVIDRFHDPAPGSMLQIVVAPCSPFSVTGDLMRESAALARDKGVRLHTHLAETMDEDEFCTSEFGLRPVAYADSLGWLGDDVWLAHAVHCSPDEVTALATSGTGVAHCPTSNMRLASGIAPVRPYLDAGVRVGLGVDGSASNDGSDLLGEARQAMLVARLDAAASGGPQLPARAALEMATRGGAEVLGRDDIGSLQPGKAADLVLVDLNRVEFAGAAHDPVAALVFCAPRRVDRVYVHGREIVRNQSLVDLDEPALVAEHNHLAAELTS
jgi:cytosine/adenosine deaminase-related metal-dependent hydrolase